MQESSWVLREFYIDNYKNSKIVNPILRIRYDDECNCIEMLYKIVDST